MRRVRVFSLCIAILVIVIISFGCSSYDITGERNNLKEAGSYSSIYVGWMNFEKSNWKDFSFEREDEWKSFISTINIKVFQPSIAKSLTGKSILFAKDNATEIDKKADLAIQFTNTSIDRGYRFGSGPWGAITTTISITNLKTNKVLYEATVTGKTTNTFGFDSQMNRAAEQVAAIITEKLQ